MMSVVAMLINIELFCCMVRVGYGEDYVKAVRQDMACAVLGFAELWVLCGSQAQRVNDFNNQKTTTYQLNFLPRVAYTIYKADAKKIQLTKGKETVLLSH